MELSEVKNLSDLKLWLTEHTTLTDVWWIEQRAWNERMYKRIEDLRRRIFSIELRNSWVTGASAAIGSVLGSGITVFIVLKIVGLKD